MTSYQSRAEGGFAEGLQVANQLDEEDDPRIVFVDGTQIIYLADMSGDGLSDLVLVRTSEVCYWSPIGYVRSGPKVAMDNVPLLDDTEAFDARRVRLPDTNGSFRTATKRYRRSKCPMV
jgi:hypothetical protein